jgi:hypothetical protein
MPVPQWFDIRESAAAEWFGALYAAAGSDAAVLAGVATEFSPRIEICTAREVVECADVSRPRPKRGAHSNFLPAFDDLARRQAVETNRRQHERREAKHGREHRTKPLFMH